MLVRRHLTPANVLSTLALVLALSGSAVAAAKLGKNAVKSRNIAPNAVTSPKVKNGTLQRKDFAARQLPVSIAGPQGTKGDVGPGGATGPAGPPGEPGFEPLVAGALVRADGAALSGTPGLDLTRSSTGVYTLDFGENIEGCGFAATLSRYVDAPAGEGVPAGMIGARRSESTAIRIETRDSSGSPADRDFFAGVAC
jgi:hypothetical protein